MQAPNFRKEVQPVLRQAPILHLHSTVLKADVKADSRIMTHRELGVTGLNPE